MSRKNRGNKRIGKAQAPENRIPSQNKPIKDTNGFTFSSVYHNWIKSTHDFYKTDGFTNMLKDAEEFSYNLTEITTEIVPKLFREHKELFRSTHNYHCHTLSDDKEELVRKIAGNIHQTKFSNKQLEEADIKWWYLGFKQNIRLIGLHDQKEEVFYPMFIDHHHLIFPDQNFNQVDYGNNDYCPVLNYEEKN